MSDSFCLQKGIPDRLHQLSRPADQVFDGGELLYRRFLVKQPKDAWLNDKNLSAAIFKIKDDSCVREKYSESHLDALWNKDATHGKDHYFGWGVLAVSCATILGFNEFLSDKTGTRQFTGIPFHDPEQCIYPHTEIHLLCNGVKLVEKKPKSIKALFRDKLIQQCEILKNPE